MEHKPYRRWSLRNKITLLIVATSVILGTLAITIATVLYIHRSDERYTELCAGAAKLAAAYVPGDRVNAFLDAGEETPEYLGVEQRLATLRNSFPPLTYVYVYQIREDGCHVVFDLDTPDTPGGSLGDVVPFDESFSGEYYDQLMAGESIPPVTSNESYGWLLSVYEPIRDSGGACVAYAGVDISMVDVRADRYVFAIRLISLLVGASILISAFAVWFAQSRLVDPINAMALAASDFALDSGSENARQAERRLEDLSIHSGDEIENLSEALQKMMRDAVQSVAVINEKSMDVAAKAELIARMQNNVIMAFANMVENRDACTGLHIKHTAGYVSAIGREMQQEGVHGDVLTNAYLDNLSRSAPLHDVGKIKVPDAILNKPGRLTPEEFNVIKGHTEAGRQILAGAIAEIEGETYLAQAMDLACYHHERWDGTGYPAGLAGEEIPLCARIMAVADVFDALISKRSSKDPMPFDQAVAIIKEESGTHFDPAVVAAFLRITDQIREISKE